MADYVPDRWVLVEFQSEKIGKVKKIFGGWYGGYMGSDWWKLSSGVLENQVAGNDESFLSPQESGSTYQVYKNSYGMTGYMGSIWGNWMDALEKSEDKSTKVILMEEEDAIEYFKSKCQN